jgi:hypothetical protein
MNTARLAIGFLAVLGMTAGAPAVRADDEYVIHVKGCKVKETKANGDSWDPMNGKPDLAVQLRNLSRPDSKKYETPEAKDTFEHVFNIDTAFRVKAGEELEIQVLDKDIGNDDVCGKITRKLTPEMLQKGVLKLENFGQVIYLELHLKKL